MANLIKLPQFPWEEPRELELTFPDNWDVETFNIAGYNHPALNDQQIKASITNLIGSPPLREIARGKKEVVIIFDDMSRVTRVAKIIPFVLEELAEAGIPDKSIRFIAALGGHGTLGREDFANKLGEATLSRFPVYNHNAFDYCTYVGTTSYGTPVSINSEVMQCDLKITIGSVVPHGLAVYSGGGKKIVPGVASVDTIVANHTLPRTRDYDTDILRLDMEEAAQLVGLDIIIECIVNMWGDTVAIFAGAEVPAYAACIQEARTHYMTTMAEDKDIVIGNVYAKAVEATTGFQVVASVNKKGGDMVLIANTPRGQVPHYSMGWWGRNIGGKLKRKTVLPPHVNRLIIFTEYPNKADLEWYEESPHIMQISKWDDVLQILQDAHGDRATVAVYPNADILRFG